MHDVAQPQITIVVKGDAGLAIASTLFHAFREHCDVLYEGPRKPLPLREADAQIDKLFRERPPVTAVIQVVD